jgi:hypothetical protein
VVIGFLFGSCFQAIFSFLRLEKPPNSPEPEPPK